VEKIASAFVIKSATAVKAVPKIKKAVAAAGAGAGAGAAAEVITTTIITTTAITTVKDAGNVKATVTIITINTAKAVRKKIPRAVQAAVAVAAHPKPVAVRPIVRLVCPKAPAPVRALAKLWNVKKRRTKAKMYTSSIIRKK